MSKLTQDHAPSWATALKIAAAYAIVGALWILCSGWVLHHFVHDPLLRTELEAVKGWFYVLVTAALLGWWLNRYFREIRSAMELRRKSEARFAVIFRDSPVAVAISRLSDGVFVDANEAFVQLSGYPREEVLGRTSEQLRLWHAGHRAQVIADLRDRERVVAEIQSRRKNGEVRDLLASLQLLGLDGEPCILGTLVDITERKAHEAEIERLSRLYATMSQINQTIVRVNSLAELTREVARVAVAFGGFKMAWVGRYNRQAKEVEPLGWAGEQWETFRNFRHSLQDTAEQPCLCGSVIRENRSCVFNDLSAAPGMSNWLTVVEQAGIRAAALFPVRVRDAVWGVFGVYEGEPNVFQDREIALLEETAMDIGYAIENIDNEAQRWQAEKFQHLSTTILATLNEPLTLQETGKIILGLIKKEVGLDAVGIRLKNGDDFPYFSAEGFNEEFLLAENSVILRSETNAACRDADGQLCLQCTCGMVLAERCGSPSDNVTAAGSLWSNDSLALVEALNGHDPRLTPRNRCVHEGFLSVALIPIRADQQMIGLLHLNDRRKDRFTPETIRFFEGLAASFGIAVKRKQAEEALRESEARFRLLIEGAPEAIFVQCGDTFRYVNRAMVELAGAVRAEDLLGRPLLDRVAPEFHGAIRERIRAQQDEGAVAPPAEQEFLRLDGVRVPVETTAVAIRFQGQDGHLVFVRDTTMRREEEKERARLEAQLQQAQKMESIGRLAGGVAHDFNNMLGVIIGHTDMLLEQMDAANPLHADLTEIRKAGERSADLTRQLLAFARKQTVTPKVIDLNRTLAGMARMLQRLIGEDIELAWLPGEKVWPVKIDPGQIDQMLANLCVNARDAIAGVGKVTIATGNSVFDEAYCLDHAELVPGEYVMLAVSDNGCGISSETMSHLFEPFFTTKRLGKGTGLGLATVYGVVKQNNGLITVMSEPGLGTTFTIYLPRHSAKTLSSPEKGAEKPSRRGHETILLVEDETAILQMTKRMLEREGYIVVEAGTPGEAIHLANQHAGEIHLLVSDVVMPEMNGRDLAKNILALYPHLKCLFMSGYTTNVIAHRGIIDEGVNFIQKPFSKGDLALKVREVLDRD